MYTTISIRKESPHESGRPHLVETGLDLQGFAPIMVQEYTEIYRLHVCHRETL